MGAAEGVDLHALLVDTHAVRHAGYVALKVTDGAYDLARQADVGKGRRIAVAEAAGFLLALEMRLDRFERLQAPVREPFVAGRLVELQLFLHVGTNARHHERMTIGGGDQGKATYARAAAWVLRQERRPRMRLVQVFEDRERLEKRWPAFVQEERRHDRLRIHRDVCLVVLPALEEVDRHLLYRDALEGEGDFDAIGGERAPETEELHGITGRRRCESARCSVVRPPKTAAGRSRGSSCRNGPQPRSSFLQFESRAPVLFCHS